MNRPTNRPYRPWSFGAATVRPALHAMLLCALAGCSSGGSSRDGAPERAQPVSASGEVRPARGDKPAPVSAADFRAAAGAASDTPPAKPPPKPLVVTAGPPVENLTDIAVLTGDPVGAVKAGAQPASGTVTIDALVGQINGKPIYADRFFSPLDAALRTRRAATPVTETFLRAARDSIYARLQQLLIDELLTAEARAELTPEQRQGLFYFVNQVRENLRSRYEGSQEIAEQRLREREGRGFEEQVEEEKRRALQQSVLAKRVYPRVNVSWRDVLRAYEKEYAGAAGKAVAIVRMIMIDAKDTGAVQAVTDALAAGKPFAEVADLPANMMPKGDAGIFKWAFQGEYGQAKLVDDEALNSQATRLVPGSTGSVAGPFDYKLGPRREDVKAWIKLDEIQRPTPVPLEDVQLKLFSELAMRKRIDEQTRFLQGLIERASFSPLTEMLERLLVIAQERYPGPAPSLSAPIAPTAPRGGK